MTLIFSVVAKKLCVCGCARVHRHVRERGGAGVGIRSQGRYRKMYPKGIHEGHLGGSGG